MRVQTVRGGCSQLERKMAEVSLEFIQLQLQSIQMQLREIKATADLDRRNTRSMYDNLAAEMARGLGEIEVKLGTRIDRLATLIEDRFNQLVELISRR
jgi:hypothetical protein